MYYSQYRNVGWAKEIKPIGTPVNAECHFGARVP